MFNDPELNGKYLGTITQDFAKVSDYLKEASYQIRSRNLSSHPIFVVSKVPTALGVVLLEREKIGSAWNYAASYIGEFMDRKLITSEHEQDFLSTYRNPDEFCCLFVVDQDFTNFVYLPYPED